MICGLSVTSFADTNPISGEDTSSMEFGVICDAEGNVIERLPMARTMYVDRVMTIPAGGYYRSYWYKPAYYFNAGFLAKDKNGNDVTTKGTYINLAVYNSDQIGGVSYDVTGIRQYYTNWAYEYNHIMGAVLDTLSPSRPYYYAYFKNETSNPITLRVVIECEV